MDAEDMEAPKQRRRLTAWGVPEVRTSLAKVLGNEHAAGRAEDAESAEVSILSRIYSRWFTLPCLKKATQV